MDAGAAASGSQQPPPAGIRGGIEDFLRGINTGIAGDLVGAGQLARHMLPDQLTDPIAGSAFGRRMSEMAEQPDRGVAGAAGNLFGGVVPTLAIPGGPTAKGLWPLVARMLTRSTLPAAIQPVDQNDPHYWGTKALQTGFGTAAGEALQGLGSLGTRAIKSIKDSQAAKSLSDFAERINQQIRRDNIDRQLTFEGRRDRVEGINQRIDQRNTAIQDRFDQAKDARAQQDYQRQVAAQTAQRARDAIPAIETLKWWREALTPTGDQALAPTAVTPEASAQVRKIVGDRLTNVRQQMLVNPNDAGFRNEIAGIREQVHDQLSNQAMRDQWAFEPERQFDSQGNPKAPSKGDVTRQQNSVWGKFVEQPLAELQYLSGRELSDYSSRLGDLAEQYARRAATAPQAERPELEAISGGLRQVVDVIDRHGTSDPALLKQLTDAKRGYHLWSIGNGSTTVEKGGVMTPGGIAREWAGRQGDAPYGAEMIQGHPQYHPENARLKRGLEQARLAHGDTPLPAEPRQPIPRPTTKWSQVPLPKRPTPIKEAPAPKPSAATPPSALRTGAGRLGRGLVAAHFGGPAGLVMEPFITAAAKRAARSPRAANVLSKTGNLGPAAAVGIGQTIPEIVVHAKRPRPEERLP